MLLSITNTTAPATDAGFLLHKHPSNLHEADLSRGRVLVFYPEASEARCTVCMLLELNPVELVRGGEGLEDYVNDRPYVASSYMTVAMSRVFGTALAGRCERRPDLLAAKLQLSATIEVIRIRRGREALGELFGPLGYTIEAVPYPLDEKFPEWGESRYFRVTISAEVTMHDLLSHLFVLLPVLDEEKHYYIGEDEVEKLLRHGEGWLRSHPAREAIVERYLRRRSGLTRLAFERLMEEEGSTLAAAEVAAEEALHRERDLERPLTLHTQRLNRVAEVILELGARSVLDLGCGEGKLLRRLLAERSLEKIAGMDVSQRALSIAAERIGLERMPERQRSRVTLFQGSLLYRDQRLSGFDAAALVEVIEHLDAPRLAALERVLFEFARPRHVVVTTPNREYNALFPSLPAGETRHRDHRFEWTRAEFETWANNAAARFSYAVRFEPLGPADPLHGAPSQMAVFSLPAGAAQ